MATVFGTLKAIFIDFLIHQRTINSDYYSKLLKYRVKSTFRSKRRGRTVTSACLLHDNAPLYTAAVTTGTLEKMHWEVLPHMVRSDFHLFGPLKEAPEHKRFRADDEVKLFV
jgi:hypothetical protein